MKIVISAKYAWLKPVIEYALGCMAFLVTLLGNLFIAPYHSLCAAKLAFHLAICESCRNRFLEQKRQKLIEERRNAMRRRA